mgnify:CR=1 FL=1
MEKKSLNKRSIIAVLLLVITLVMTFAFPAGAAENKVYWVSNEEQFISAVNSSRDSDIIKLTSNITLSNPIKVKKSVSIDLQGYKLYGSLQYESKEEIKYNYSNTTFDKFMNLLAIIFVAFMYGIGGVMIVCQVFAP